MTKHWKAATPAAAGAAALLAAAVLLLPGRLWSTLGRLVVGHWLLVLLLAVAGVTGLAAGWVLWRRARRADESSAAPVPPQRPLRPLPTWILGIGFLAVVAITWAAVWGLQFTVPAGVGTPLEQAQLQVETIRTGLSVGAGFGAAAALLLALRRQQVTERTQQATEYDAGEKRVTELYVKAADQLGSDKAPVRLAGLYALERLAQDNPVHRQSIVEVICAYLRMPYTPPAEKQAGQGTAEPEAAETTDAAEMTKPDQPTQPDPREERQVRLAAQRILARHLRPTTADRKLSPTYWNGVAVDLTEATLLDIDFSNCHLTGATFARATFTGTTRFADAKFTGNAPFTGAAFTGNAWFDQATFTSDARFAGAAFAGNAWFDQAAFTGLAWFVDATFSSGARFADARFTGAARFDQAAFTGNARFDQAAFADDARFVGAAFSSGARFASAVFTGDARFDGATFDRKAAFGDARVGDGSRRRDVWPMGWGVDLDTRRVVRVPGNTKPQGNPEPE